MGAPFTTLEAAVSSLSDGASVAVTKFNPMALAREIIRQGRRGLHLIGVPTAGLAVDLLVAAGCARSVEAGAFILGEYGTALNTFRAIGRGEVQQIESSCPIIEMQLQAGASGFSFTPLYGVIGSDLASQRPDFKIIDDPFDLGHEIMLAPSLRPDVALIHGLRADTDGNIVTKIHTEDRLVAQAASHVIATVEEVRADALDRLAADEQVIPALYFDSIVIAAGAASPLAAPGYYANDVAAIQAYLAASRDEDSIAAYINAIRASAEPALGGHF